MKAAVELGLEKRASMEKKNSMKKEVEALRALIKQQEYERINREPAILAEAKAKREPPGKLKKLVSRACLCWRISTVA